MTLYLFAKFFHIIGIIMLGGGLTLVWIQDFRIKRSSDVIFIAGAYRTLEIGYNAMVLPGAILAGLSGIMMIAVSGIPAFSSWWLIGMWGIFAFEFIEGNSITRLYLMKCVRASREAAGQGMITPRLIALIRYWLGNFTHYLDIPLFIVMVALGVFRPESVGIILLAIGMALCFAVSLTIFSLRLMREQVYNLLP